MNCGTFHAIFISFVNVTGLKPYLEYTLISSSHTFLRLAESVLMPPILMRAITSPVAILIPLLDCLIHTMVRFRDKLHLILMTCDSFTDKSNTILLDILFYLPANCYLDQSNSKKLKTAYFLLQQHLSLIHYI